jgi:hypothetical protein
MKSLHKIFYSADILNSRNWPEFGSSLIPDQQFKVAALTFQFPPPVGSIAEMQKNLSAYINETLITVQGAFHGRFFAMFVMNSQPPPSKMFEYLGIWKEPSIKALLSNIKKGEAYKKIHGDITSLVATAEFRDSDLKELSECITSSRSTFVYLSDRAQSISAEATANVYERVFRKRQVQKASEPLYLSWPHAAYFAAENNFFCIRFDSSLDTYGVLFDIYGRQQRIEALYKQLSGDYN